MFSYEPSLLVIYCPHDGEVLTLTDKCTCVCTSHSWGVGVAATDRTLDLMTSTEVLLEPLEVLIEVLGSNKTL